MGTVVNINEVDKENDMTSEHRRQLSALILKYGAACRNEGGEWARGNLDASAYKELRELIDYLFEIEVTE
jgi:hypothetical protein